MEQMTTENDKGSVRVFVYGSLKQDKYNNDLLRRVGAKFIGFDYIEGPFCLVDLGPFPAVYGLPHINQDTKNRVYGELWMTNDEGLAHLDYLEGHPNFYRREKIWTGLMDKRAWCYFQVAKEPEGLNNLEIWRPTTRETEYWKNAEKV